MSGKSSWSLFGLLKTLFVYVLIAASASALTIVWWGGVPPKLQKWLSSQRATWFPAKTARTSPKASNSAGKTPSRVPPTPAGKAAGKAQNSQKKVQLPPLRKRPLPRPLDFRRKWKTAKGSAPAIDAALLLNGGGSTDSNYFSHHLHIQMLAEVLLRKGISKKQISVFSSDGNNAKPDLIASSAPPQSWMFQNLPEYQLIAPTTLINTTLPGFVLNPAKKRPLRRWLRNKAREFRRTPSKKTLLFFVTDHGRRGKNSVLDTTIELWNDSLTVRELRGMIRPFGRKHRIVSVMSQCFSGGFAQLQYTSRRRLHGNRCGFFATLATREAYGCFPDVASGKRIGYAYRMIRAMRSSSTVQEAHRKTMLTDRSPDVPLATSDVYLRHILQRRARRRGQTTVALVDRWVRKAMSRAPQMLKEERTLLAKVQTSFRLKKTRTLASTWRQIRKLRQQRKLLKKLEQEWTPLQVSGSLNVLLDFYKSKDALFAEIKKELDKDDTGPASLKLGRKLHRSYLAWLEQNSKRKKHLRSLYWRSDAVSKAIYQNHVQEAAYLRVATLLTRMAGFWFLKRRGSRRQRRGLRQLLACEKTPLGSRAIHSRLLAEGSKPSTPPTLNPDTRLTHGQLVPSWLGISFEPAPRGWNARFARLAPGAVRVEGVQPNSPADNAGLQTGDIVVSIGSTMLQSTTQIRELVMLAGREKKTWFLVQRNNRFLPPVAVQFKPITGYAGLKDVTALRVAPGDRDDTSTGLQGVRPRLRKRDKIVFLTSSRFRRWQRRKNTLLFFWATWCTACKQMIPTLRRLQKQNPGLRLVAVTSESRRKIRRFLHKWGEKFPFQVGLDRSRRFHRRYGVVSLPTTILFAKGKRRVHWKQVGASPGLGNMIQRKLQELP